MSKFNTINFENYKIIVIIDNNNIIWFNAKQICSSLKYKQAKQTIINNVDKIDKIQLKNMNITFEMYQQPDSIYINESGLYTLLITSKNKKAKKFIKWVTSDVLPELRKKNIFSSDKDITKLLKKINELETKNKLLQNDLKLEKFPGAMVYHECVVGQNCIIHAGAVIGADGFGFAPDENGEYQMYKTPSEIAVQCALLFLLFLPFNEIVL